MEDKKLKKLKKKMAKIAKEYDAEVQTIKIFEAKNYINFDVSFKFNRKD